MSQISQTITQKMIKRAEDRANQLDVKVCIAITDAGGHLCAFKRMDNAFIGSIDVAIKKAKTSSLFPLPSGDFGKLIRDQQLTGMELSNHNLIGFPGGHPIWREEQQIGAIGISGASAQQDAIIAEYAQQELS